MKGRNWKCVVATWVVVAGLLLALWPASVQAQASWSFMNSGTVHHLRGVWGSDCNVYAVGEGGTILHYEGTAWNPMDSGTDNALNGVWGTSGSDIFAVGGGGTILHYDGTQWSAMSSGTTAYLEAVWGSSGSDVFAVGWGGTILHYDGTAWIPMSSGMDEPLFGVWGSNSDDVFAVGGPWDGPGISILHYDGTSWAPMSSSTPHMLLGVWGTSGTDVFAVGGGGSIIHYDGTVWSTVSSSVYWYAGVWGSSSTDVFAVGFNGAIRHYDGMGWSIMWIDTETPLNGVWGSSGGDVFAVGSWGTILHYGGPPEKLYLPVDIKPTSCPNPLPLTARGVLPVAILGFEGLDAACIDPASVQLEGVSPLRWAMEDVAAPFEPYTGRAGAYDCTEAGPDGTTDLTIKFKNQEVVAALGEVSDGEVLVLSLTGLLKEECGGLPFEGEDVVIILDRD